MKEKNNSPEWSLEIQPKRHLLDINIKELWNYRDLIGLFIRRDFVSKYKQTILGPLWFIIQPLFSTLMYTIVFGRIAGIPTNGLPHILFYLSGIVCWTYFSNSLKLTSQTFVNNAQIFGKVYFPRLAVPISIVISNFILFGIQFLLFLVVLIIYVIKGLEISIHWELLWLLPLLMLLLAGLSLGFGIIVSSLTTKYRDLTHLISFGIQLWMYATPIIYPLSQIPDKIKPYVLINPISSIVESFKYIFLGAGEFSYKYLGYSTLFCIVLLSLGILLFNKVEKNFMDTV